MKKKRTIFRDPCDATDVMCLTPRSATMQKDTEQHQQRMSSLLQLTVGRKAVQVLGPVDQPNTTVEVGRIVMDASMIILMAMLAKTAEAKIANKLAEQPSIIGIGGRLNWIFDPVRALLIPILAFWRFEFCCGCWLVDRSDFSSDWMYHGCKILRTQPSVAKLIACFLGATVAIAGCAPKEN